MVPRIPTMHRRETKFPLTLSPPWLTPAWSPAPRQRRKGHARILTKRPAEAATPFRGITSPRQVGAWFSRGPGPICSCPGHQDLVGFLAATLGWTTTPIMTVAGAIGICNTFTGTGG